VSSHVAFCYLFGVVLVTDFIIGNLGKKRLKTTEHIQMRAGLGGSGGKLQCLIGSKRYEDPVGLH
jgi:hypothetical protein